jgi:hypothetical protein
MTTETPQPAEADTGVPPIDPRLIAELFDMDPLKLSDQDLDLIIAEFRSDRMSYLQAPVEKKEAKAKAVKGPKVTQLDLSDLGLD